MYSVVIVLISEKRGGEKPTDHKQNPPYASYRPLSLVRAAGAAAMVRQQVLRYRAQWGKILLPLLM